MYFVWIVGLQDLQVHVPLTLHPVLVDHVVEKLISVSLQYFLRRSVPLLFGFDVDIKRLHPQPMPLIWGTLQFSSVDVVDLLVRLMALLTPERSIRAGLQQLAEPGRIIRTHGLAGNASFLLADMIVVGGLDSFDGEAFVGEHLLA